MRLIAIAAAGLSLAGCQTLDDRIAASLPAICANAAQAHAAFTLATLTGRVPDRTIALEAAAWRSLQGPCADPTGADTATVLVAAAQSYALIADALNEAEGG